VVRAPGDRTASVGFNGEAPRGGDRRGFLHTARRDRAMGDDDDIPDAGSTRAWLLGLLSGDGANPSVPATAPRSGIGLGTVAPWLVPLLGDRPLSPAEEGMMHARVAAEAYCRAGDAETAAAILEAIAPKRGRGRPPEWTGEHVLNLAIDVGEVLRANPRLLGTSAITVVARLPQWRGWSASTLRSRFTDRFAAYNGLTFKQAIEVLRGSPRSAD
jgi:hypothetical protein